jgi:hypothetical protein
VLIEQGHLKMPEPGCHGFRGGTSKLLATSARKNPRKAQGVSRVLLVGAGSRIRTDAKSPEGKNKTISRAKSREMKYQNPRLSSTFLIFPQNASTTLKSVLSSRVAQTIKCEKCRHCAALFIFIKVANKQDRLAESGSSVGQPLRYLAQFQLGSLN